MFSETVQSKLRKLDVYRKLPQDLTEATMSGAILSIIAMVCMSLLFVTELSEYLTISTTSEMFVDINRGGEKLNINVDITFPRYPCGLLSLDAQDVMGSHIVNVGGTLLKRRLNSSGTLISVEKVEHGHQTDIASIKKQFDDGEGCQILGNVLVNKVPGNFHISSHAQHGAIHEIIQGDPSKLDLSHQINHLSFGDTQDIDYILKSFTKGVLNPLDSVSKIRASEDRKSKTYEYYIKVVPTTYFNLRGAEYHVHQFTANGNEYPAEGLPAVYFRYDLSPVTVKFTQVRDSFFHFLVQVCAIVGGIYTVAGLVDNLIHTSVSKLLRKTREGKVG